MNFKDKQMLITLWVNLNDNNNEICMNEAGPTHALYIPIYIKGTLSYKMYYKHK